VTTKIANLRRDRTGTAALEFALIAPIAITLGLAAIELGSWLRAERATADLAGTLAVAVAEIPSIDNDELADLRAAVEHASSYLNYARLAVQVTSVQRSGTITVAWSESLGGDSANFELPEDNVKNALTPGDYGIVVQLNYDYSSFLDDWMPNQAIQQEYISFPNRSEFVERINR